MTDENINLLVAQLGNKFPSNSIMQVRNALKDLDDKNIHALMSLEYKDPIIAIIVSVVAGVFGIDRFYLGDIGLGVLKLITGGGCGIWAIVDLFLVMDITKQKNLSSFLTFVSQMK